MALPTRLGESQAGFLLPQTRRRTIFASFSVCLWGSDEGWGTAMASRTRSIRTSAMAASLVGLICLSPAPGYAAATCAYTAATNSVRVSVAGDFATIVRSGTAIEMNGSPCGSASVDNTNRIDLIGNAGDDFAGIDLSGGPFVNPSLPGDIPISVKLGSSVDSLSITGSANADSIRVGDGGINLNAGADSGVDVTLTSVEELSITAGGGADVVSAAGGGGTGAAYALPISEIDGGPGNDHLVGGSGDDRLIGGPGSDVLDGGPGSDTADYQSDPGAVTANLTTGTATDGTGGSDTLAAIENLDGPFGIDSTLTGDAMANSLFGQGTLSGAGGNDVLQGSGSMLGGDGTDTFRCFGSVEAVVDLSTGLASCAQVATLAGIENVTAGTSCDEDTGCPIDLTGDAGDNVLRVVADFCPCRERLAGGGGDDTLVVGDVGGGFRAELRGGHGKDTLIGRAGPDTLWGGQGADLIRGGRGGDRLYGQRGADALGGGRGNDLLDGGLGIDHCNGGPGADTLIKCE
jgi:Ca2+-binding RTX toxin-like protein